jgi:hypothetical protein
MKRSRTQNGWNPEESPNAAISLVNTVLLFPQLDRPDRGEGVPEVPVHQALLHNVIEGLKQGDHPVSSLVADERWNVVCSLSYIPWHIWQRELHRHGQPGFSEAWTGSERATCPILDLLLLGACPGIEPGVMLDLLVALGPYLRSSQEGGDCTGRQRPLGMGACAGGQATYGPYIAMTKDGLVRVEQAGLHVGTLKQSRWGWLAATYEAEVMCEALPRWIAGVEPEEQSRPGPGGVPSAQFWTQVQGVLEVDCILGCNPLVAPSAVPCSYRTWGTVTQEGWSRLPGTRSVSTFYNLLTMSMDEQRQNCLIRGGLAAGGIWYALTSTSTLDPHVKALLLAEANPVHVFGNGTRAAAARGSWPKGIMRATNTADSVQRDGPSGPAWQR